MRSSSAITIFCCPRACNNLFPGFALKQHRSFRTLRIYVFAMVGNFSFFVLLYLISPGFGAWVEPSSYVTCPSEGKRNISFRNYCEMYTVCEQGTSRLETCPDGLHFNSAKGACDFPANILEKCEPLDNFSPTTSAPPTVGNKLVLRQNFDCDPVDVIVKRRGKRKCKVQVICSNGISFLLKRCMQTISLRI